MFFAIYFGLVVMLITTLCFFACIHRTQKTSLKNSSTKNTSEKRSDAQPVAIQPSRLPPSTGSAPKRTQPTSCERSSQPPPSQPCPKSKRSLKTKNKPVVKKINTKASSEAFLNANGNNKSKRNNVKTELGVSSTQPSPIAIVPEKSLCADKTQSDSVKLFSAPPKTHKTEESEEECELVPFNLKLLDEKYAQPPKTPAHARRNLVVPEEKVNNLGELDKVLQAKKAALQKEIEEMSSTHEFDKPGGALSSENAAPIDPKRHVVIAENKCQRYTISSDEVEEAPTQSSIFNFTPMTN